MDKEIIALLVFAVLTLAAFVTAVLIARIVGKNRLALAKEQRLWKKQNAEWLRLTGEEHPSAKQLPKDFPDA